MNIEALHLDGLVIFGLRIVLGWRIGIIAAQHPADEACGGRPAAAGALGGGNGLGNEALDGARHRLEGRVRVRCGWGRGDMIEQMAAKIDEEAKAAVARKDVFKELSRKW